jgi:hypothetical protein
MFAIIVYFTLFLFAATARCKGTANKSSAQYLKTGVLSIAHLDKSTKGG